MVRNNVVVFYSMFTLSAPFAIRYSLSLFNFPRRFPYLLIFPMFPIQGSLFTVRCAVRHSPGHSPFAAPFAVAFQCPLTLSIEKRLRGEWRTLNRKKQTAICVLIHFIEINANFNVDLDLVIYAVKNVFVSCLVYSVILKFIV